MKNRGQINSQEQKIQGLLDRYLKVQSASGNSTSAQNLHLDDDSLTAFAEGNLSKREAGAVVSHLVDCSFCRHITAELVRLDLALAEKEAISPVASTREPSRVSEVLSGLLSRIFGTSDGAVFAHNESDKEEEDKSADDEDKEEKN